MSASKLKVYTTLGSPPSTAVLAALTALGLSYDEVNLDFMTGEHLSAEHEKVNI
jgi:glutathione S-transferase